MTGRHGTPPDRPWLTIPANTGLRAFTAAMVLVSALMTLGIAPIIDPVGRPLPTAALAVVLTGIGVQRLEGGDWKVVVIMTRWATGDLLAAYSTHTATSS